MKVYSQLLDLSKTTPQTFWVAPNSSFKLGVKLVQKTTFKVLDGDAELVSDGEIDGFKTYSLESTAPGMKEYVVEAANGQKIYIKQVTTDSTVFEVGGGSIPEGNFMKSVNGELPVNGNVNVTKLMANGEWLMGDTIAQSLSRIDEDLAKKLEESDIAPIAPSTDANEKAIAGAKATADFVNSSIATNTANFKGTFKSEADFPNTATNNDYLFFDTTDDEGNKVFKRFKYSVGAGAEGADIWQYEYTLNNSSFTAAQWETINSGITPVEVADMAKKSELNANTMTLAGEYEDGTTFNYTVYIKNA